MEAKQINLAVLRPYTHTLNPPPPPPPQAKFCERYGIDLSDLQRFEFDGEALYDKDTPEQQDMDDDCLIDATVSAEAFQRAKEGLEKRKAETAAAAAAAAAASSANDCRGSGSSSSSSGSSSRVPVRKPAVLSADNRIVVTLNLTMTALVTKTATDMRTELKSFTDMTLQHVHELLLKKGVYRAEIANDICYTAERDGGKTRLLDPTQSLLDLRIDDDAALTARLPNIQLHVCPQGPLLQGNKAAVGAAAAAGGSGSGGNFEMRANPSATLDTFIEQLVSAGVLGLPREQLRFVLCEASAGSSDSRNGSSGRKGKNGKNGKNGKKDKDKDEDEQGVRELSAADDAQTSLHHLGFVDGSTVKVYKV